MRYFLEIAFDGTGYSGWQLQINGNTVQAEINKALSLVFGEEVFTYGCGRTDTGVHATQFYLHFDTEKTIPVIFIKKINGILPDRIAVFRIIPVEPNAHARFHATHRAYEYKMVLQKSPFLIGKCLWYRGEPLDFEKMQYAASLLPRFTDFYSLCRENHSAKTTICTVTESFWTKNEHERTWVYRIAANRFLRSMVRLTMGAMLHIGSGKLSVDEFVETIENKKRFKFVKSASPHGLYLVDVKYAFIEE